MNKEERQANWMNNEVGGLFFCVRWPPAHNPQNKEREELFFNSILCSPSLRQRMNEEKVNWFLKRRRKLSRPNNHQFNPKGGMNWMILGWTCRATVGGLVRRSINPIQSINCSIPFDQIKFHSPIDSSWIDWFHWFCFLLISWVWFVVWFASLGGAIGGQPPITHHKSTNTNQTKFIQSPMEQQQIKLKDNLIWLDCSLGAAKAVNSLLFNQSSH